MAVRSRRFFGPTTLGSTNTWTHLYTVPAERTAVFRCLLVTNPNGSSQLCKLATGTAESVSDLLWNGTVTATESREILDGLVLNPAQALWANLPATNIAVFGSGSLLLGAPT